MKVGYFITGCIILILSAFFVQDELVKLEIQRNGRIVDMEIIKIPGSCLGTKAKWFMKVKYQNEVFVKQIRSGFCEDYKAGDLIKLKYQKGRSQVLFPNEGSQFLATALIALVGCYVIFYSLRRENG